MSTERRVFCTFCEQTFRTTATEKCPLCRKTGGLVDPMSPGAVGEMIAGKRQQSHPAEQLAEGITAGVHTLLLLRRLFFLIVGGLLLIGLGALLALHPDLRANPRRLSFSDLLPGIGAAAAGLVLLFLAYLIWKGAKTDAAARSGEKESHSAEKK